MIQKYYAYIVLCACFLCCLTGCGVVVGTLVDTVTDIATYPVKEYIFLGAYQYDNTWKDPYIIPTGETRDHGELLLGIAVSGGGSRSAYFMACVMEQLDKIPISPGSKRTYADEVDYISCVSGGSLASTYFCYHYKDFRYGNRDTFFKDYKAAMKINFQNNALLNYTMGLGWLLDFSTYYDRGDLMAQTWDQILFDSATFRDMQQLEKEGSPILLINGTILNDGLKFVFSNLPDKTFNESEYFEQMRQATFIKYSATIRYQPFYTVGFQSLNSDIQQYPLSKAVVASASVPNLIGPVTLRDYTIQDSKRLLHIVDGGVYDNYGLETLMQIMTAYLDKSPGTKSKILVIDGSGYFEEDNRNNDKFTVADYSMRPLSIAWMRTKSYMEYIFQSAKYWKNAQGQQPYSNLTLDLISLYGFWSTKEEAYGRLPSQSDTNDVALEKKVLDVVLRPDLATQEFFKKIVQIPTSFHVSQEDAASIEKVAIDAAERFGNSLKE